MCNYSNDRIVWYLSNSINTDMIFIVCFCFLVLISNIHHGHIQGDYIYLNHTLYSITLWNSKREFIAVSVVCYLSYPKDFLTVHFLNHLKYLTERLLFSDRHIEMLKCKTNTFVTVKVNKFYTSHM